MKEALALAAILVLAATPGVADDPEVFGNLTFSAKPGGEISRTLEVARCLLPEGCNGTLQLRVTGEVSPWLAVSPPILHFADAPRGTRLDSTLHGQIPPPTPPGNYSGRLEVHSLLEGDRWSYLILVTVQAPTGGLTVYSEPVGVEVHMNGSLMGLTPLTLSELPAATHTLLLRKEGYTERRENVTVAPDQTRSLAVVLPPRQSFPWLMTTAAALGAAALLGTWRLRRPRANRGAVSPDYDRIRRLASRMDAFDRDLDTMRALEMRIVRRLQDIKDQAPAPPPTLPEDLRVLPHRVTALEHQVGRLSQDILEQGDSLRQDLEEALQQIASLREELKALPAPQAAPSPLAPKEMETVQTSLRQSEQAIRDLQSRVDRQELTFARGEEARSLFRDLSRQKEDLAHIQLVVEQLTRKKEAPTIVLQARGTTAPPAPAEEARPAREELQKKIGEVEEYLATIEEFRGRGVLSPNVHRELQRANEQKLETLRRQLQETNR